MEVHAHTHTERKKFTHYLWEFLMLFLAVFCGFLAENQREHIVEHQREKKFVESLLEDLKKDTADLENDIPFWNHYLNRVDTLQAELKKPAAQRNQILVYRCMANMRRYNNFEYHDRTIDQLKNAGNFRLIRNKKIADSLIDYDANIRSELRDQEVQSNSIWQSLNFLQDRFMNSDFFILKNSSIRLDSAAKANPSVLEIRKNQDDDLFEYYNRLDFFRVINAYRNGDNKILLRRAIGLIQMIQKEYHFQ